MSYGVVEKIMKIKTQVSISIIVFAILATVIIFSVFSGNNQLHEIQKKQQIIDNIEKSTFELYYLENDYITHGGTRPVERWNAKYAALTGQLQELTVTDPSQQAVFNDLVNSHRDLNTSFSNLVALSGSVQGKDSSSTSQELKEFSASTLAGQTQMMISSSFEFSQLVKTEAREVEQRTTLIVFSSIAVLMVFVLLNYLLINRSVLKSISALQKGAGRIGSGDLDTKIEIRSTDELGDLSLAITAMAANLKTVLTSKSALEKEVAERTLAEEALKKSEEKYRTVFENTGTAMVILEESSIISLANDKFAQLTGFSKDDIEGKKSWTEFVEKENLEWMLAQHRQRRQNPEKVLTHYEFRAVTKSGDIRTISLSINMIPGTTKSVASLLDITDRKRAEETLKESEERFRAIFNNASDAIHIHEIGPGFTPGKFIDVNDVACRMLKMSREEILSHSPLDFATEYHNPSLPEILQFFTTKGHATFETGHRRIDGVIVPVEINSHIINLQGKTVMLGIIRDITERKRAEVALRESEEKFRQLFSRMPSGVAIYEAVDDGEDFVFRDFNTAGESIEHIKKEEVIGRRVTEVFPGVKEFGALSIFQRVWRTGKPEYFPSAVYRDAHDPGTWREIWTYRLPTGEIVSIYNDVTERKLGEMALQQANRHLNLLSSITRHDILNQLMALKGYLYLSHEVIDNPTTLTEYIKKEEQVADTIEAQIVFTKDYQELGAAAPVWQNVNASIKKAVARLPMRDVHVDIDRTNLEIFADSLFEKVFFNLIDNALRYGGEQMKTIRVSSQESDTSLTILCEDDGVGITAEDKKRLFTKGFGKHTGLGLFLSREILAITGITITENGTPDKGARFEIVVPKGAWRFGEIR